MEGYRIVNVDRELSLLEHRFGSRGITGWPGGWVKNKGAWQNRLHRMSTEENFKNRRIFRIGE